MVKPTHRSMHSARAVKLDFPGECPVVPVSSHVTWQSSSLLVSLPAHLQDQSSSACFINLL